MGAMFLLLLAFIFASIALYQLLALAVDLVAWAFSTDSKRLLPPSVVILNVKKKDE